MGTPLFISSANLEHLHCLPWCFREEDFENIKLENIESDEEFERASAAFDEYMEQMELIDDEDE